MTTRGQAQCAEPARAPGRGRTLVILGNPNVGKSALFNKLTGRYADVSNYPGTTVEITTGRTRIDGTEHSVIDTPGMHSLTPLSEEERVARDIFFREPDAVFVHVADAKNLLRALPVTLQLIESGRRIVLAVNMMDEARRSGVAVDLARLEAELGIPVVGTVASEGTGVEELKRKAASL